MEQYQNAFNSIQASDHFKRRMVAMMQAHNEPRTVRAAQPAARQRIPAKRRALLITIAAILLLLSACAAYAIYWSSTQRAKEYAQSEVAVDDRQAQAERQADAIIAGLSFYSPLSGTAEVDGITFEPVGVCYYPNENPPQVNLSFNSEDSKTGDISRMTDFDYVLTVGGKDYPAYAKADGTIRALPAIAIADSAAFGAELEMWFRIDDQAIVSGMPMKLTGTLYSWDNSGQRGENLGSFSFNFIYEVQTEQIEAERARLVKKFYDALNADAEERSVALSLLPNEMTELNITQDEYTFTDAQATKDGFLLGQTRVTYGAEAATFYMDGYRIEVDPISNIYTPDLSRPRQDVGWEVAYYGTYETVTQYPWYAPIEELPETVLIAVLRDAGSDQRTRGDVNGYYEGDRITYAWNAVELLLRVNPRTGEITLPKDEAESKAWREETLRLAEDGRNNEHIAALSGSQTINGVTVELEQIRIMPNQGIAYIECKLDGLYYPGHVARCLMEVSVNGLRQSTKQAEALIAQYTTFSAEQAQEWVDSYGGWQIHHDWLHDQSFDLEVPRSTWEQDFTIRLIWDVYDRDENWNSVYIGSFDISATVKQDDIISGPEEEIHELWWKGSITATEGNES